MISDQYPTLFRSRVSACFSAIPFRNSRGFCHNKRLCQSTRNEIDISGWDIRKALYLFTRTNGALFEWLKSPIKYSETGPFAGRLRQLAPKALNDLALRYHYSHMARSNAGEYILKDQVKLKKYFYVLRPLLAIRYIEQGSGFPPVRFQELVDAVAPEEIRPGIATLLDLKRNSPEVGTGDPIVEINDFIKVELARHEGVLTGLGRPDLLDKAPVRDELNEIFRETIDGI